jgi:polar amino acid transport system substrate-binding protein
MDKIVRVVFSYKSFVKPQANSFYSIGLFLLFMLSSNMTFAEKIVLVAAEKSIPTSYIENGEQSGILIDVINEAFNRAGYSVEIFLMPWARCLREVENGTVDGIFSVYKTAERQEFLTYADEVLISQVQAFFVAVDSTITFDGDLQKLANKSIGIINQTSYGPKLDATLEDGVFNWVSQAQSSESTVRKLLAGRIDLIPSYRHVALSTAKALGARNKIKQLSPDIEAIPSFLAFSQRKDFSNIITDFNSALASMKKDGTYDVIFNKYLL